MFTKEQIESLEQELDSSRIKSREKGNINLSYLEAYDVIETANLIFGYGNWNYTISTLEVVSHEQNQNQNNVLAYKAVVKVVVHSENHSLTVTREDVGFGSGIAKSLSDAHESGAKEAVTDALKRALRSFGNQFGNSLYDKSRNHQATTQTTQTYTKVNNTTTQPTQQKAYQQTQQTNTQPKRNTPPPQQHSHYDPYEYESLNRLGLEVLEDNGFLIITGDDQFSKKDSIKACGFNWDKNSKTWYKPINQAA